MTLADEWREGIAKARQEKAAKELQNADRSIERLQDQVRAAMLGGEERTQLTDSYLPSEDIRLSDGSTRTDYFPTREDLKGATLRVFDFCINEGIHLYIGPITRDNELMIGAALTKPNPAP